MDPKENKELLKKVREHIKNKEYENAIGKCKQILLIEPENYMGLVLLGAAYQESDKKEAAKYLRKATQCSKEPIVALQGLVNCADSEELPGILKKLLKLLPDKYGEYHNKIALASTNNKNVNEFMEILKNEAESTDEQRRKSALKTFAKILIKQSETQQDWEHLVKPALDAVVNDEGIENHIEFFKRYLKQLYKLKEFNLMLAEACRMSDKYPEQIYSLEWICKIYCENYKIDAHQYETVLSRSIESYADQLLNLNQNSGLAILIKALKLYESKDFIQSRNLLTQLKGILPDSELAMEYLAMSYKELGAYKLAQNIFQKLNPNSKNMAICLSFSSDINDLKSSIKLLEHEISSLHSPINIELITALARGYYGTGESTQASKMLTKLRQMGAESIAIFLQAEFTSSPEDALTLLNDFNEDFFELNLLKGRKFAEIRDFNNALKCLLKATKQKTYYSECFRWLGNVYVGLKDINRAKKCFEKCIYLNPHHEIVVIQLSAMYKEREEWDLNSALLQNIIKYVEGKDAKWALFQLGLHHLSTKNFDEAIHNFRSAIRYDLKDVLLWEVLADCYFQRGSYNSAMKVYQKILEIDQWNNYAKLQIAVIKTTLHMYLEGIVAFNELLSGSPNYLPALKEIAEAHYKLATDLLEQRLLGRCKQHLQEATMHLQKAFLIAKSDVVWLWRNTANVFVMVACLPLSIAYLNVSGKLSGQEKDTVVLQRQELFEFAAKFYTRALMLHPENSLVWHELSLCYYKFGNINRTSKSFKYLKLAMDSSIQAIRLQPSRWQNWNLLGVIHTSKEIDDLAVAQHCFIKALELDRKIAVTWTNLGVIYLISNEIKLANLAFQKAQQSNPLFVNAWIGQAIIAEELSIEEEAMDLFRHCTQLEFHVESALGYAHWVCNILSNREKLTDPRYKYALENMHAIPVALDSINWYAAAEDLNSCIESLSYCGYLNFKAKLWRSAIKAYGQAITLAKPVEKDKLLCNLGYVYLKNREQDKAIDAFNSVSEATLRSTTGLALAYFSAGQYEESYSVYSSALEWLTSNEAEKALILAAVSPMVYAAHGEQDTRNVLFQCIALSNAPIEAFFAACALGILHGDYQLSETILEDLRKNEDDSRYCHHIAFLNSEFYLSKKQVQAGLIHLLSRVHLYPQNSYLRGILANYILQNYHKSKRHLIAVSQVAQSTMILGLKDNTKTSDDAARCLILASNATKLVDKGMQLKLAQRAVHVYPALHETWNVLKKCFD